MCVRVCVCACVSGKNVPFVVAAHLERECVDQQSAPCKPVGRALRCGGAMDSDREVDESLGLIHLKPHCPVNRLQAPCAVG